MASLGKRLRWAWTDATASFRRFVSRRVQRRGSRTNMDGARRGVEGVRSKYGAYEALGGQDHSGSQ